MFTDRLHPRSSRVLLRPVEVTRSSKQTRRRSRTSPQYVDGRYSWYKTQQRMQLELDSLLERTRSEGTVYIHISTHAHRSSQSEQGVSEHVTCVRDVRDALRTLRIRTDLRTYGPTDLQMYIRDGEGTCTGLTPTYTPPGKSEAPCKGRDTCQTYRITHKKIYK